MVYDVVILTDPRYINPKERNVYVDNVIREDEILIEALKEQNLKVIRKSWDDSEFDWKTATYALFRATWDYFDRFDEFMEWLKNVSDQTLLINSKQLIDWNIDKHYMQELKTAGIRIPKTLFIEKGTNTTLLDSCKTALESRGFKTDRFILKPCVSGAARHTYKFDHSEIEEHEKIFKELISNEAMMLQEFQHNIVNEGEISIMVFGGTFTHAVLKIAKSGDFRVQDDYSGTVHHYEPSQNEIDFAEKVVRAAPELPIYARVDIFRDNDGNWALAELEIFEPELWFRRNPEAADLFAKKIKERFFK